MRTPGKAGSPAFDTIGSRRSLKALTAIGIFAAFLSASPSAKAAADKSLVKSQEGSSALLRGRFDLAVAAYDDALKETNLPAASQAGLYSDRGVASGA